METKDYTKLTSAELLKEEKKLKRSEIISSVLIGFLVGVIIYGFATKGFGFLYVFISAILIAAIYRNSKKVRNDLKHVREIIGKGENNSN
jgi:uncharacterized membrane protein YoaK (UPF0700 family)